MALRRGQQHIVVGMSDRDLNNFIAIIELHRNLAVAIDVFEVGERVAPDVA